MPLTLTGKTSLFGTDPHYGIVDHEDSGSTASGISETVAGIAVYNHATLGGYWRLTFNGQTHTLVQSDIGPAPWTGRTFDFTPAAAAVFGINPHNFPTDTEATGTYLGPTPTPGRPPVPSYTDTELAHLEAELPHLHDRIDHLRWAIRMDQAHYDHDVAVGNLVGAASRRGSKHGAVDALAHTERTLHDAEARIHAIHAEQPTYLKALAWERTLADRHFRAPGDINPVLERWARDAGLGDIAGQPWCQYFQDIAWHLATGLKLPYGFRAGEPGYTPWVLDQARRGQYGLRTLDQPRAGCWVYFRWPGDGDPTSHIGMCITPGRTVEGNTGGPDGAHSVAYHGAEHWMDAVAFVWPWDMRP